MWSGWGWRFDQADREGNTMRRGNNNDDGEWKIGFAHGILLALGFYYLMRLGERISGYTPAGRFNPTQPLSRQP